MKFASEATIEILEKALGREEETRDFYRGCLAKSNVDGTKVILEALIKDEEDHVAIVSEMLKTAGGEGEVSNINIVASDSSRDVFDQAFPHGIAKDASSVDESETVSDMLKKALKNEKESHDNYAYAAEHTEEKDARKLFRKLAHEEKKHFILIDNLINYLDDPGTWLYSEENDLFNL